MGQLSWSTWPLTVGHTWGFVRLGPTAGTTFPKPQTLGTLSPKPYSKILQESLGADDHPASPIQCQNHWQRIFEWCIDGLQQCASACHWEGLGHCKQQVRWVDVLFYLWLQSVCECFHEPTSKPQNLQTPKLQSSQTPKLQNPNLQNSKTPKLQDHKPPKPQNSKLDRLPTSLVQFQNHKAPNLHKSQLQDPNTPNQKFQNSKSQKLKTPKRRNSPNPKLQNTNTPKCPNLSIPKLNAQTPKIKQSKTQTP